MFLFGGPDLLHALYLVPLARSRYCASPEASIMRLKAAPTLDATASAPTIPKVVRRYFSPQNCAAILWGVRSGTPG